MICNLNIGNPEFIENPELAKSVPPDGVDASFPITNVPPVMFFKPPVTMLIETPPAEACGSSISILPPENVNSDAELTKKADVTALKDVDP